MALEVGGPGTQNPATGAPLQATAGRGREKPAPQQAGAAPAPAPRRARQRRMVVRRLDLWSVLKVSLCFYLCGLAVTMVAGIVLWIISSSLGMVHNVEQFMGDLLSAKDFKLLSAQILEGATLVGLVIVILLVIVTLVAAAFYNLFAELIGGVEIIVDED
jgi:Transmembrane domain of unknown function (DUF3566)